jgi:hypothetical protein
MMMKNNGPITIILSLLIVIGGIVLNFQEFLMGSPATINNLVVTVVYIIVWVLIILISIKYKSVRVMKVYAGFWLLTLFFSILTVYVNVVETGDVSIVIPFVILLITPWYGISYNIENFAISSMIIAVISLVIVIITVLSIIKNKR